MKVLLPEVQFSLSAVNGLNLFSQWILSVVANNSFILYLLTIQLHVINLSILFYILRSRVFYENWLHLWPSWLKTYFSRSRHHWLTDEQFFLFPTVVTHKYHGNLSQPRRGMPVWGVSTPRRIHHQHRHFNLFFVTYTHRARRLNYFVNEKISEHETFINRRNGDGG